MTGVSSDDGRYLMSPQGIGGDDRCGVYMILQIINEVRCHVLFCEDEETGGNGARAFAGSGIQMDVNYIVEMDRRGNNDAVFYDCSNPEFTEFVCAFGFQERMLSGKHRVLQRYFCNCAVSEDCCCKYQRRLL